MRELTLEAEVRNQLGKHTHSVRRAGKVPGVFYLHGEENIPIAVIEKNLKPLIYTSETHIINLKLNNGNTKNCILRDVQFDPLTDLPIHFDLQGLREDEKITLEVPIIITGGTPIGVREGGVLQQIIYRLKITCLPKHIPEHIEINVENLKINNFVHVSDLKIENVTILENESSSIVGVMPPTVEKEVAPAAAVVEETVEPEVIGKGKKVEEGAEGEAETEKKAETKPAASAKEEKK
ncbi:MAG: 50S ribosomal protein L25 [Ignavibacteriales bacterium]|nr:50S ribosomal protein L25 [Ignavibacteriales bacterium]